MEREGTHASPLSLVLIFSHSGFALFSQGTNTSFVGVEMKCSRPPFCSPFTTRRSSFLPFQPSPPPLPPTLPFLVFLLCAMSSYHSKALYSPPDGSSGSLPITPTEEDPLSLPGSSSLPPSLGKLILNRSTPYYISPPSSFGSTSSSSSSSLASQPSTMSASSSTSSSVLSTFGSPSSSSLPPPHVALLPPPAPKTYQYVNHQHQQQILPPPSLPLPQTLNRIVLPPLEPFPRHLPSLQHASASSSLPQPPSSIAPPSQPHPQRPQAQPQAETANRRHEIKFHELREQQQLQHQLQQQQRLASTSSSSQPLPPPARLPPPNTVRKPQPPSTSTSTSDSSAQPSTSAQAAEYPMMSLVVRKRRRRTSPAELAILDAHFAKNALPTVSSSPPSSSPLRLYYESKLTLLFVFFRSGPRKRSYRETGRDVSKSVFPSITNERVAEIEWGGAKDAFAHELFDFRFVCSRRTPRHIQIWVSTFSLLHFLKRLREEKGVKGGRPSFVSIRADLFPFSSRVPLFPSLSSKTNVKPRRRDSSLEELPTRMTSSLPPQDPPPLPPKPPTPTTRPVNPLLPLLPPSPTTFLSPVSVSSLPSRMEKGRRNSLGTRRTSLLFIEPTRRIYLCSLQRRGKQSIFRGRDPRESS